MKIYYLLKQQIELLKLLGVVTVYCLTSHLLHVISPSEGDAGIFFLYSGIALAALLIGGKRYFWAVLLGAFLSNMFDGVMPLAGAAMALGSAFSAVAGAWLIRRDGQFDSNLLALKDIVRLYVWGGFVGCSLGAIVGVTTMLLSGVVSSDNYLTAWFRWWMGDVLGVVLMSPLLLIWWPRTSNKYALPSIKLSLDWLLTIGVTVMASGVVFLDWGHASSSSWIHDWLDTLSQAYWMFLFISWSAVRLGRRGTSLVLLLVAAMNIAGVYQGMGYFAAMSEIHRLHNYWFYTLILSVVGMALAIYIEAGKRSAKLLLKSEKKLGQELKNTMAALNQHAIVITTDVQGCITTVNDRACEISGYSREELLGKNHRLLNSGKHPKEFFKGMYETLASGQVWQDEICNRAKDGHFYWVETTISPFIGGDGKPIMYVAIRNDITKRKANELQLQHYHEHLEYLVKMQTASLQQSVAHLHTIFEALDDMIWLKDAEGAYLACNPMFERFFGIGQVDLIGKTIHDFNGNALANVLSEDDWLSMTTSEPTCSEEWGTFADDGHRALLEIVKRPVFADGKLIGVLGIARDVTQRKQNEQALQAASHAKSEFLANMSHEIRTPMNGVVGMLEVLQQTMLNDSQYRMIATIHHSALALLNILNDILDYSKIEAGKLSIERIPTHLREVAEEVAQLMSTIAANKSIELSLFVSPELPSWILTDPTRLRQIIFNLMGNAIKFTSTHDGNTGKVMLNIERFTLNTGEAGVQLRFTDTGIGMKETVVRELFQPFTQADESTARKFGGTGLGLSISQRLVALLGGRIGVSSILGEGSEFTVELPLEENPSEYTQAVEPVLFGVHVLVLIGDAVSRKSVKSYCIAAGAKVTQVDNVDAVVQHLKDASSVVVLGLDAQADTLPDDVGIVHLVGSHSTLDDVISVSAHPLYYQDLIDGVAQACGRISLPSDQADLPQSQIPGWAMAESALSGQLILLADDNETNREVMQDQLRLLGYAADVACDGVEALLMWRTGHYAMLLTDCQMQNMDGFELTAAIRKLEPEGTRMPIVAVTANAMQSEAQHCKVCGMDDYLSKPLRLNELAHMLTKWLPQFSYPVQKNEISQDAVGEFASNQVNDMTASMNQTENHQPLVHIIWDSNMLTRIMGDNPAMQRRVLEKFLLNAQEQVTTINIAAKAGDTCIIADVTHKLKSAARTVGAFNFGELCQELEIDGYAGKLQACRANIESLNKNFLAVFDSIKSNLDRSE